MDITFNATEISLIEKAAKCRGLSILEFVKEAALLNAASTVRPSFLTILEPSVARELLAEVDQPFTPSAKLRSALQRVINKGSKK